MKGKITNHKLEEIKLCCANGMTVTQTAQRLDVTYQTISYWAKRCDLRFFKHGSKNNYEAQAHAAEARLRETWGSLSGNFTLRPEIPSSK